MHGLEDRTRHMERIAKGPCKPVEVCEPACLTWFCGQAWADCATYM